MPNYFSIGGEINVIKHIIGDKLKWRDKRMKNTIKVKRTKVEKTILRIQKLESRKAKLEGRLHRVSSEIAQWLKIAPKFYKDALTIKVN